MNNFDITDIENTLKGIVRESGVSETVYSNRPKATPAPKDDFVVVSVVGRVNDRAALGDCQVLIYLFARDAQAFKNGAKLSKMYQTFRAGLPGFRGWDAEGGTQGGGTRGGTRGGQEPAR